MIHFIIEGVLVVGIGWCMYVLHNKADKDEIRHIAKTHQLESSLFAIKAAIDFEEYIPPPCEIWLGALPHKSKKFLALEEKLKLLEDHLKIEYKSECTEKLPKYIKKSK